NDVMKRLRMWIVVVVALPALVAPLGFAFQSATSATAPRRGGNPEAAKVKNPVPSSPETIAAGRQLYARLCSRCHGPQGKGDGGGAGAGGQPADFTDEKWDFGSS